MKLNRDDLVTDLEERGGEITHEEDWRTDDGSLRTIGIEVYFDRSWTIEFEEKIDDIVLGTKWYVDWHWDFENQGIKFEWFRDAEPNTVAKV